MVLGAGATSVLQDTILHQNSRILSVNVAAPSSLAPAVPPLVATDHLEWLLIIRILLYPVPYQLLLLLRPIRQVPLLLLQIKHLVMGIAGAEVAETLHEELILGGMVAQEVLALLERFV